MGNKKGFTLIELVVVTLIIATLALLVAPSFKNSTLTTNVEKAKIGLVELNTAVKFYYEVNPGADDIEGLFNNDKWTKLKSEDSQGYVYLHNAGKWVPQSGSYYSLAGVNCKYTIGAETDNELTSTECLFTDDDNEKECYKFFINKDNPAVIQRAILDVGSHCENM